jgi:hypothetical protein
MEELTRDREDGNTADVACFASVHGVPRGCKREGERRLALPASMVSREGERTRVRKLGWRVIYAAEELCVSLHAME